MRECESGGGTAETSVGNKLRSVSLLRKVAKMQQFPMEGGNKLFRLVGFQEYVSRHQ